MADGIATIGWVIGRCYYHIGTCYGHRSIYFILSSEVFNRTSSQICGRRYMPKFLLRDGLLTLIYRASLIVLMRFWASLPTMLKFLNWFCDQWCYSGHIWGWGLLMFLEPLSKCSGGFPYIFFMTLHPIIFISVDDSTFLQYRIFVLWSH